MNVFTMALFHESRSRGTRKVGCLHFLQFVAFESRIIQAALFSFASSLVLADAHLRKTFFHMSVLVIKQTSIRESH